VSEEDAAFDAACVTTARAAQKAWAQQTLASRVRAVAKAKRRLLERATELADALREESGEALAEALFLEIVPSADVFDYWLRAVPDLLAPIEVDLPSLVHGGKSGRSLRAPRGVIALFTPPEYALALPLRTIVPALLAGNAVLWIPAEKARRVSESIAAAFAGLVPSGVFTVLRGDHAHADELISKGLDWVFFAGEPNDGRKILAACAQELTPASVELGGDDAAIVLEDAKLERTSRGIVWAANALDGKSSFSIKRVYAEKKIAPKLTERISALAKGTKAADLSVVEVDGLDQAVERVRASRHGLTTSVWTASLERTTEIATLLGTPVVSFNCHGISAAMPEAPWGGRGESGFGVTNGPFALDALTRPSFILEDRSLRARDMYWQPYTPTLERAGKELAKVKGGASFFGRLVAWFSLFAALTKRFFES
jgi:acyl-CoA reductase-like NAD-dependent aldehyde dehydrogenase